TTTGELATSDQLFRLQQGTSSVNHYTLHFRTLAAASGWNEKALLGANRQGLNHDLRAAMVLYDDSIGLEAFLQRTTKVAQNLAASQPPITAPQPASVAACHPVPEPMQIDSSRLIVNGLCFTLSTEVEISSHVVTCNFISQDCLNQLNQVLSVKTIQGKPLGVGKCDTLHPSSPCKLVCFIEDIKFLVLEDSTTSIILGRPWLQQHHPELSWDPDYSTPKSFNNPIRSL
ncbi:hypothetical protein M9458_044850, partial [Cirrhinus mrigala]